MAAVAPAAPSLNKLDEIPETLPPVRQRVYTRRDLEAFNLLSSPVWVFDVRQKGIWWANDQAVELWDAASLEDLLARDFAVGMSKASENHLSGWLERFHQGETNKLSWTFHPNGGKDGPKTCDMEMSGIFVNSKTSCNDESSKGPWLCMLVVVDKVVRGESRSEEDARMIRRTEMLKHFPIVARQFDFEGKLVDQNPEAMAIFGSPSKNNSTPAGSVIPRVKRKPSEDDSLGGSSHRTSSTGSTSSPLNDFLAQFVDIDEGRQIWEEAKEGNDYSTETLQHTVQGVSWFSIDVRQVLDPVTGEKVIIFSARDISKLMRYAQDQVEKQNQARNEFFAVMAHEIRTPLHQVIGSMELLQQSKMNEDQADNMQILQTSSKAMMAIINDALDFTKLEAGKLTLELLQFKVRGVIEGCVAAIQQQAESKGLCIETRVEERIPAWLVGDPNRFRQVLSNLLTNAVKFSSSGSVEVRVRRQLDDTSNRVVLHFSVQDNGIGIKKERQEVIFDAYQQADTTVSRTYGGTGMGLSISKSLVELMGGRIGVKSEVGKGSKFWFEIPFQQYDDAISGSNHATQKAQEDQNTSYRILVVEDNKVNQKVICKMLQRLGHTTKVAENGQVALDALEQQSSNPNCSDDKQQQHYHLVLMDWQMPVMDGIEATQAIRRMGYSKRQLPIIGLTASIQGRDWLDVGMNECLKKPIRLNELKSALSRNMLEAETPEPIG